MMLTIFRSGKGKSVEIAERSSALGVGGEGVKIKS